MDKLKISIAGGTGYTAGELIRILLNHPAVEITNVISTSSVGTKICDVHRDLFGDTELVFTDEPGTPDVLFLCLGHGISREFLSKYQIPQGCKIIDLGNDFRLSDDSTFEERNFTYGLCEMNRRQISASNNIANPGCFATAIQLAILPLLTYDAICDDIHVTALTGSTGAGKKLSETSHFSYRSSNISIYKPFTHQHLGEINQTVRLLTGKSPQVNFVPLRGDFTRGIFASVYTKSTQDCDTIIKWYSDYYQDSPFVHISEIPVSLKEVVGTNKALLHIEKHNGYVHITSIIDNLVKGACGQAVQNMNLIFGLDETMGLKLKPIAF